MNEFIDVLKGIEILNICSLFNIIGCLLIIFIFYVFRGPATYLIVRLLNLKEKDKNKIKKIGFYKPLKTFFLVLGVYLGIKSLGLSPKIEIILEKAFRIIVILLVAKSLTNMTAKNSKLMNKLNKKLHMANNGNIVGMVSKIIACIIYAFAGVIIINELGYDVNGLIAGIGLGGLTVALAAQDAASNIFGGLVIIFDKPFSIGDWIKVGTIEGVVEEITFRSTRIRTFDNTLVVIPNNKITNDTLNNCSKMEKRRIKFDIQINMNVSMKKLNLTIQKIRDMLLTTDNIIEESVLVFFDKVEDSGYNMFVSCFTTELDYANYLAVKEKINYNLVEILNKEKVELAYPSKTVYLESNSKTVKVNKNTSKNSSL